MGLSHFELAETVRRFVFLGMRTANDDYEAMSGGEWVSDRGVESFIAGQVGRELRKCRKLEVKSVVLEASLSEIHGNYLEAGFSPGRRGRVLSPRNRIDVTVLDASHSIVGVVELKRNLFLQAWMKDIVRVATIANRTPGLQFGCFAGFVAEWRDSNHIWCHREQVARAATAAARKWRLQVSLFPLNRTRWKEIDGYQWRSGIIGCVFTKR